VEAVVWPMREAEKFKKLGIKPPKGMYFHNVYFYVILTIQAPSCTDPPVPVKPSLPILRTCATQTNAKRWSTTCPDVYRRWCQACFALAKEKAPAIIFIDELDAVGTKRFDSEKSGDREVQRTMLEFLNQLDGFSSDGRVKALAATNRVEFLTLCC